jgi:predicted ATPase/DNA-binding SARP family transcriptional activator
MEFRILGRLEVITDDGPVELARAKQRALLAVLLLHANEVVSTDTLIEALWPGRPPASAGKLLQVYVSQLRQALGAGGRIATRSPGYLLALAPDELDSTRFELLVVAGRDALARANAAVARRALGEALELWRGPALAEFVYDEFARAEAERLAELHEQALEERIEADLALARHEQLVAELEALVERFPLRERLWRQLMLALYRSGRQAEALDRFTEARRTLDEELGLDPSVELRDLQAAILRQDPTLAPPARADAPQTNVPAPLVPLLGRERELSELVQLLTRADLRLLTISGAGGTGKTTLALEAARSLGERFANGTYVVELAPLHESALVPTAVADALRVQPGLGETIADALGRRLRNDELLLVVDNAEHLPDVGVFLVGLLRQAPALTVLVTSRAVLHVTGEYVYPLQPLPERDSVVLFVERARAAGTTIEPGPAVSEICRRLDGLPLAVELAAARTRTHTVDQLLVRLDRRLPLLTDGPRDLPARQQTLRATIEWSYDLLSAEQQRSFAKLAVFAGGFDAQAAEEVAEAQAIALERLLEANLLRGASPGRLDMLETIREYAFEHLAAGAELAATSRLHIRHYLALSESLKRDGSLLTSGAVERVAAERDNLRAAMRWALDVGEPELALELAASLGRFWAIRDAREGYAWLCEALSAAPEAPVEIRAHGWMWAGTMLLHTGEYDLATEQLEKALMLFRELEDVVWIASTLERLAVVLAALGEDDQARERLDESLTLSRSVNDRRGVSAGLRRVAELEWDRGAHGASVSLTEEALELSRTEGDLFWTAELLADLAERQLMLGDVARSVELAREGVSLASGLESVATIVRCVTVLADAATHAGEMSRAALLWAAAEAFEQRGDGTFGTVGRGVYRNAVAPPTEDELAAPRAAVRTLTFAELVAQALA